jgi:hypothetical protein
MDLQELSYRRNSKVSQREDLHWDLTTLQSGKR